MSGTIKDTSLINKLITRYQSLEHREQLALNVLGVFITVIILLYFVVLPAVRYQHQSEQQYRSAVDTISWMKENQSKVSQQSGLNSDRDSGQSLLGIANKTSKSFRLSFKRYQPVGDNGLSLWLEDVSFNGVMLWLERLDKRHKIIVKEITIDRADDKGAVNVRLVLQG